MENWPQNCWFCIFNLHVAQIWPFLNVWELLRPTYTLKAWYFCLFAQPVFPSSYGLVVFQMENCSQNCPFCTFDLLFAQLLSPFCMVESSYDPLMPFTVQFWHCFVCTTIFSAIYGFTVFQMEKWPLETAKMVKVWSMVKNTKSSILRPIFYLEHCKSRHGLNKWLCKQNNTRNVLWTS